MSLSLIPTRGQPHNSVWLLGKHRLCCGDARDLANIHALLDGALADMVFTDPPYNVRVNGPVMARGQTQHPEFPMASGEMSAEELCKTISVRL